MCFFRIALLKISLGKEIIGKRGILNSHFYGDQCYGERETCFSKYLKHGILYNIISIGKGKVLELVFPLFSIIYGGLVCY